MSRAHPLIKQLKEIRQQRGMSQDDLAEKLGYNKSQLSRWELGKSRPNAYIFFDWCTALGVDITLKGK